MNENNQDMVIIGRVSPVPKDVYNPESQYKKLDVVRHEGNLYLAKKPSVGIVPTEEENEYWMLAVKALSGNADGIKYDNSESKMDAENVQEAIDELAGKTVIAQAPSEENPEGRLGSVKPDGETVTVDEDGTIHGAGVKTFGTKEEYEEAAERGEIKPGMTVIIKNDYTPQTGVDEELSETSTNPVQNKVITAALNAMESEFDEKLENQVPNDIALVRSVSGRNIHLADTVDAPMLLNGWVKNLLKNIATTATSNGVTFTVNVDGSISISGTASATVYIAVANIEVPDCVYNINYHTESQNGAFAFSTYYFRDGSLLNNQAVEGVFDDFSAVKSKTLYIGVNDGVTVNTTIRPQLELGNISHSYVPYDGYDVVSCGRNLNSGFENKVFNSETNEFTNFGTSDYCSSDIIPCKESGTITVSVQNQTAQKIIMWLDKEKKHMLNSIQNGVSTDSFSADIPSGAFYFCVAVRAIDHLVEQPDYFGEIMINYGGEKVYEPYTESRVHVANDTPAPQLLESFAGETNIFAPSDVSISYAVNSMGADILAMAKPTAGLAFSVDEDGILCVTY